jgi:hypothetical protein
MGMTRVSQPSYAVSRQLPQLLSCSKHRSAYDDDNDLFKSIVGRKQWYLVVVLFMFHFLSNGYRPPSSAEVKE